MAKPLKNPPKSQKMLERIERLNAATMEALRAAGMKRAEREKEKK